MSLASASGFPGCALVSRGDERFCKALCPDLDLGPSSHSEKSDWL